MALSIWLAAGFVDDACRLALGLLLLDMPRGVGDGLDDAKLRLLTPLLAITETALVSCMTFTVYP